MTTLEIIKLRLNIKDTTYDDLINEYIALITAKLKLRYHWDAIPDDCEYLVENLVYAILRIKRKLSLEYDDESKDEDILTAIDDVYQEFLNYLHLAYLPKELTPELIDGCTLKTKNVAIAHDVDPSQKVKSVKEGDTTVQFGLETKSNNNISGTFVEFFQDIRSKLNEFRAFGY